MIFSHSRLSSFENCRKQFHFRYILDLPQETEGVEAFVGKRVHEVLERLHEFVDRGMLPSLEKVLARYHALFDEHFAPDRIRIVRSELPLDFYRDLGARCVRNYYMRQYPFDSGETLGLEHKVQFSLDAAGEYPMRGFVDRIVRAPDDVIEIHDYKTGQRVPSQKQLDKDRQLALYQIGVGESYGPDRPMRLVWHYVATGQVRTSTRSPEELAGLRRRTIRLIDRIREESEFAPKKIPLCDWCEYRSICPAWTNAGATSGAPPPAPKTVHPPARRGRHAPGRRRQPVVQPGAPVQLQLL